MKMKHNLRDIIFLFLLILFSFSACRINKPTYSENLIGHWKSEQTKITVRTEPSWMKFEFISDVEVVDLIIDSNLMASGRIGDARFKDAKIRINGGNPDKTGVAYIVKCGPIGKIFGDDPLDSKEVELWLGPIDCFMPAELRYTEGGAQFPMADIKFIKVWE